MLHEFLDRGKRRRHLPLRPPGKAKNEERELAVGATECAWVYVLGPWVTTDVV
jgi:hypothetical protein